MNKKKFTAIIAMLWIMVLVVFVASIDFAAWRSISDLDDRVSALETRNNITRDEPVKTVPKTIPASELTKEYAKELATFYSDSVYRLLDVKVNSVNYSLNILRTDIGPILLNDDQAVLVREGDLVSVIGKFNINSESKVSFRHADLYEVKFNDIVLSTFDISNTYYNLEGNT